MRSGFLRRSPISLHGGIGVYVHCNGGKGRSAVCVICYLARILAAVWFEGVGVSGDKTVQGNTATEMAMEPIMRFWMEINGDNLYFSSNMSKIWKFVDILLPFHLQTGGFHAETPTPEKAYDHVSSKRRIAPGQKGILAENGLCSF